MVTVGEGGRGGDWGGASCCLRDAVHVADDGRDLKIKTKTGGGVVFGRLQEELKCYFTEEWG